MDYDAEEVIYTKRILRMGRLRQGKPPKYKDLELGLLPEFEDSVIDISELGDIDLPPVHASIFS